MCGLEANDYTISSFVFLSLQISHLLQRYSSATGMSEAPSLRYSKSCKRHSGVFGVLTTAFLVCLSKTCQLGPETVNLLDLFTPTKGIFHDALHQR
jgi:hypothetical protein